MEAFWYYASGDNRKGPVGEDEILRLRLSAEINDESLVWTDGMADWVPFKTTPLAAKIPQQVGEMPVHIPPVPQPPALPPASPGNAAGPLLPVPQGITGWMKFNALMLILQGASYCLGCVWIILGVPLIMSGIALFGGAGALENVEGVSAGTLPFFQKFRTFNLCLGIFHIVMIVVTIIGIIVLLAFFGTLMTMMQKMVESGAL